MVNLASVYDINICTTNLELNGMLTLGFSMYEVFELTLKGNEILCNLNSEKLLQQSYGLYDLLPHMLSNVGTSTSRKSRDFHGL